MAASGGPIALDAEGRFAGYASVFNRRDAGGDVVMQGAFAQTLARRRARIRMLFQHDPKEPVGIWESLVEDGHGLLVAGRLVPGVARADGLRRLIAEGALDGLSIGFRTVRASKANGLRQLWQIELYEISIVTFPMLEDARIASPGLTTGAAIRAATQSIRN